MAKPTTTRQTFAYTQIEPKDGNYLKFAPQLPGWFCTGWSAGDLFIERDDAMTLLAKIAVGDCGDPRGAASDFFEEKKENTYTYYDPEDDR